MVCRATARSSGSSPRHPSGKRGSRPRGRRSSPPAAPPGAASRRAGAFSRSLASISPSAGRAARAASPAARKVSHQAGSAAAVTPSERGTISNSSPRSSRSAASRLRGRDIRPTRPDPTALVSVVAVVVVHLRCGRGPVTRCPVHPRARGQWRTAQADRCHAAPRIRNREPEGAPMRRLRSAGESGRSAAQPIQSQIDRRDRGRSWPAIA